MRKIVLLILVTVSLFSCKKDKDCLIDLKKENSFVFFNRMSCGVENFTIIFKSKEHMDSQTYCANIQPIPFPFEFDGIIIAQGVKAVYGGNVYDKWLDIKSDMCSKEIFFKFYIQPRDTSQIFEHNENVIVLLEGIDSTYTVNFKHEIIPYRE